MSRSRRQCAGRACQLDLVTLDLEQSGRVLTARVDIPPVNYVTAQLLSDLDLLTTAVDRDPSVGAVVLASAVPGRYLTHADAGELQAFAEQRLPAVPPAVLRAAWVVIDRALSAPVVRRAARRVGPRSAGLLWAHTWKRTILRMNRSSTVYVAAISGPVLGGGLELALACDLRYAADDPAVTMGQIELLAGLIPGGGGTQRLPRLIGTGHALELILEGAPITAAEAHRLGLVHRLIDPSRLLEECWATAVRLAHRSPAAVAAAKRAVYAATDRPLRRGLDHELAGFVSSLTSDYARRAAAAFAEDAGIHHDSPFVADPRPWVEGGRLGADLLPVVATPAGGRASRADGATGVTG